MRTAGIRTRTGTTTTTAGRRSVVAAALGVLLATVGCTGGDGGTSSEEAAQDLADALAARTLDDLRLLPGSVEDPDAWWARTIEGLGDSQHSVEVDEVEVEGDEGEAVLAHEWKLAGTDETWTYETAASLAKRNDDWVVALDETVGAPDLGPRETLALVREPAKRADILGADGDALVKARPVLRFGIDKTKVAKARMSQSARRLAKLVEVDAGEFVERVEGAGDQAFVEAIVLRRSDASKAIGGFAAIKGAVGLPDSLPLAPTSTFARPILGSVGEVTAEIVEESDGRYEAGDVAGVSGLQARYDEQLAGTPGVRVDAVKPDGERRTLHRAKPVRGEPLRTTLDEDVQTAAERALSDVGPASAIVAIEPSSATILAAADGPGSEGYATSTIGQYAPGSTFKVATALGLLRSGASPQTPMTCPATTVVDGKSFKNYDDYPAGALGRIDLRTAIANSCNTALIDQADELSQTELADAAAALGLGIDQDLGAPAYLGEVPRKASGTEHAASMIGQGQVLASPLAMATVAASVSAGETVVPALLPDHDAEIAEPSEPLRAAEARQLRTLMRAVVTEGSGSFLADVPGPPVLAKTGTAEFGADLDTHAWMIAVQGDLAVAVFVETGESGSQTAGPLLETFLRTAR